MTRFESFMLGFGTALILLWCGQAWGDDMDRYPPPGSDGRIMTLPAPVPKFLIDNEGWVLIPPAYTLDGHPKMPPGDLMMPPRVFSDTPDTREHLIRQWAASGDICRVIGHRWEYTDSKGRKYLLPGEPGEAVSRHCPICGKVETKVEEWK